MPPAVLIDTGATIAIIDASASQHQDCLEALSTLRMPLLTTEAVLAELFHLIRARHLPMDRAWHFLRSGALTVSPISDSDLPEIDGLMTIPPPAARAEDSRPYFARLRELRDRLAMQSGYALSELSMGMTDDFEIAIEEGATIVRIGRAVFGERIK